MGSDGNGSGDPALFALVAYIPPPLGRFLDDLRKHLAPGCIPHAHVTILPPRPLRSSKEAACQQVRSLASEFAPFRIEVGEVLIFPVTNVIYLGLSGGVPEMRRMHDALNHGAVDFEEPFAYQPHVTLAQDLTPEQVEPLYDRARQKWADFPHERGFQVEKVAFVERKVRDVWIDLAEIELNTVSSVL